MKSFNYFFGVIFLLMTVAGCSKFEGTSDYQKVKDGLPEEYVCFYTVGDEYGGNNTEAISCDPSQVKDFLVSFQKGMSRKSFLCTIRRGKVKRMVRQFPEGHMRAYINPNVSKWFFYEDGTVRIEYYNRIEHETSEYSYDYSITAEGILTIGNRKMKLIKFTDERLVVDDMSSEVVECNPLKLEAWMRYAFEK